MNGPASRRQVGSPRSASKSRLPTTTPLYDRRLAGSRLGDRVKPQVPPTKPSRRQINAATAVVTWYLDLHFGRRGDSGTLDMFCDPEKVGHFSVSRDAISRSDARAMFRLLVAISMFQRRQDQQILRILRSLSRRQAGSITSQSSLLAEVKGSPCAHMKSVHSLSNECDLAKDDDKQGCCTRNPSLACHLKEHTVLLRRYGHFGKVPTSIALAVRETAGGDLNDLRRRIMATYDEPYERAVALESALSHAWRISQKIASMFLSCVANPDLSPGASPWSDGVDWSYFVVVDSNVDLFLQSIGYLGVGTYDARRRFIREVAAGIDLSALRPTLHPFNPRLVQQAMYLFMSIANRRATEDDCGERAPATCKACPKPLTERCPRYIAPPLEN